MKDLEDELGVRLLVRGKNAVTLTEAGELFYEDARDLLARADQAVQRVRGESRNEVLLRGLCPVYYRFWHHVRRVGKIVQGRGAARAH